MKLHEEVLNEKASEVAKKLGKTVGNDFYLAGGTGLALQIGHRISLDFDLFSSKNRLLDRERRQIIESLRNLGALDVRESIDGTCHLFLDDIAVSLFHYNYPLIRKINIKYKNLPIASEEDIAAMKLSAAVGRGTKKDFIDLFFLAKALGLEKMIKTGTKKFREHNNFSVQATRALVYFDDAEKDPMPRMLKKTDWNEIKIYLEKEVNKVLKSSLNP